MAFLHEACHPRQKRRPRPEVKLMCSAGQRFSGACRGAEPSTVAETSACSGMLSARACRPSGLNAHKREPLRDRVPALYMFRIASWQRSETFTHHEAHTLGYTAKG